MAQVLVWQTDAEYYQQMSQRRAALVAGALSIFSHGVAGPTSLNFMPIADILGHRQAYLEYNSTCLEHHIDSTAYHCGALEVGLFNRIEFGIDLGLDPEYHSIWNAKIRLAETKNRKGALSAGLWNCDDDYVEPYAVGSYDFSRFRLHLGISHDDASRLMAGADGPIGKHFGWMADFMSGTREQFWLGLNFNHPHIEGLGISWSVGVPLNGTQGWQGMIAVGDTLSF